MLIAPGWDLFIDRERRQLQNDKTKYKVPLSNIRKMKFQRKPVENFGTSGWIGPWTGIISKKNEEKKYSFYVFLWAAR